jgi:hypothetical protein
MTSPVFVDPSGRRRWVLRIAIGTAVTCVLAYLTLLAVALAGGPVNRSALLPVPDEEAPVVVTTAVATTTTTQVPVVIATTRATTTTTTEDTTATTTTTTTETATTKPSTQGRRSEAPGASNRPTTGRG